MKLWVVMKRDMKRIPRNLMAVEGCQVICHSKLRQAEQFLADNWPDKEERKDLAIVAFECNEDAPDARLKVYKKGIKELRKELTGSVMLEDGEGLI